MQTAALHLMVTPYRCHIQISDYKRRIASAPIAIILQKEEHRGGVLEGHQI